MKRNSWRMAGIIVMLFCAFQLGRIHEETEFLKRLDKCVHVPDTPPIQEFYGHNFKELNLQHTIWNHAVAHNSHIYMNCIFKDLNR